MSKFIIPILTILLLSSVADAAHVYLEKEYQAVWCNQHNGLLEYRLDDLSHVDSLTEEYAI